MKLKRYCLMLTLATALLLGASTAWAYSALKPPPAAASTVLRMASPYPAGHPSTQTAEYFARLVEEGTDGRILVQVSTEPELDSDEASLEQLRFGGIAFSVVRSLSLPREARSLRGGAFEADAGVLDRQNIAVLAALAPDYRCIANNTRPLYSRERGDGLALQASAAAELVRGLETLGFSVVSLSGASLDSSLNYGYIQGAELAFMEYASCDYARVLPHLSLFDGPLSPDLILASQVTLGGLSAEDQRTIAACAAAAADYQAGLLPQSQAAALERLAGQGVPLLPLAAQETPPGDWFSLRESFVGSVQEDGP